MKNSNKAFTLIELLVVIAIIGILSSVVLASLSGARKSARDATRKQDLGQIQTALELVHNDLSTYQLPNADNNGWFAQEYGTANFSYQLKEQGYTPSEIMDPSGGDTTAEGRYMIKAEKNHYTLWANLENPSQDDLETLNNCYFDRWDSSYGMNYCVGQ